jgi:GMP synthase (glutamine-hydrolysing)
LSGGSRFSRRSSPPRWRQRDDTPPLARAPPSPAAPALRADAALSLGRCATVSISLAVLQNEHQTGLGRFAELLDDFGVEYDILSTHGRLTDPRAFDAALCLGGGLTANDETLLPARRWIRDAVHLGLPYLGVCLGGQLLAHALGARVRRGPAETGVHSVFLSDAAEDDALFGDLPARLEVFGWHGDCFELPRGAIPLAGSIASIHQAFRFGASAYALQFHPEVRPEDVARWRGISGYRQLLDEGGREWDEVVEELARAASSLDALAAHLLERWLDVVRDAIALRERAAFVGLAR